MLIFYKLYFHSFHPNRDTQSFATNSLIRIPFSNIRYAWNIKYSLSQRKSIQILNIYLLIVTRHNTKYSIFFPIKTKGNCLLHTFSQIKKKRKKKENSILRYYNNFKYYTPLLETRHAQNNHYSMAAREQNKKACSLIPIGIAILIGNLNAMKR